MITIHYCPKCYGAVQRQKVGHFRGLYCSKCKQWGMVERFNHMHLAQMWIKWKIKQGVCS